MNKQQMINELSKGYAPSWQRRLEQMPEKQVAAIYQRQISAKKQNS